MKRLFFVIIMMILPLGSLFLLNSCSASKSSVSKKDNSKSAFYIPDYKQIKKDVNVKDGEFYYPDLLKRFEAADTTMTADQIYHIYYGAATLSDYDPYYRVDMKRINDALMGDTLTEDNWKNAAQIIEEQLAVVPTDLKLHIYKQIVYDNLYGQGSNESYNAYNQVIMLVNAMMMSGDGKSMESAVYINSVSDEYGLLSIFGLNPTMQSLTENRGESYDVLELEENDFGLKSFYFNITNLMEVQSKIFGF